MATQWGRKETIIWPPHAPIMSYSALATALLCTLSFHLAAPEFLHASAPAELHHGVCALPGGVSFQRPRELSACLPGRGKMKPRLALPVDFDRRKNDASER